MVVQRQTQGGEGTHFADLFDVAGRQFRLLEQHGKDELRPGARRRRAVVVAQFVME